MRTIFLILVAGLVFTSCSNSEKKSDAYGNFEATEVLISAQQTGILENYTATEGKKLKKGEVVGLTDTLQLYLKRKQYLAQKQVILAKYSGVDKGIDVQVQQKANTHTEMNRVKRLLEGGAATAKQLDDIEAALSLIEKQIISTQTQYSVIQAELTGINVNIETVNDQISRCEIVNPLEGTVLQSYVEQGELVTMGKPLYKIADLSVLQLKVYVSGAQLSQVALGDTVTVLTDKNKDEYNQTKGVVTWIASEAEFTPKIIQTKEERVNLVYAMKVNVPNTDGIYKIGMPAEVVLLTKEK
ncbi:MAG: efflux RND transporter periplasmic adaptor subunit [Bacteroidales bacterium]|nr:efflux RND transporter periplasmic adaptor subunit [Bacteroidales bacterium]